MRHTLSVMGDSHSAFVTTSGGRPTQQWHQQFGKVLQALGCDVQVRGFAKSGAATNGYIQDNIFKLRYYDEPSVAFIHGGVNDPPNGITEAQTKAALKACIKALKYGAMGPAFQDSTGQWRNTGAVVVATEADLPAGGRSGQRYVVLADGSSDGGQAHNPSDENQLPTITGSISGAQSVWGWRSHLAGTRGWGRERIATSEPTHVSRIVVVNTPYRNFASGTAYDSLDTPYSVNVPVRRAQKEAVDEENVAVSGVPSVILTDLYGYMRAQIVSGRVPDFRAVAYSSSRSWHVADADQHLNPFGKMVTMEAVFDGGPEGTAFPAAYITYLRSPL